MGKRPRPAPHRLIGFAVPLLVVAAVLVPSGAAHASVLAPTGTTVSIAAPFDTSDVYVADTDNNQIVKIAADGTRTVFATGFGHPFGVAVGPDGNVYVGDTDDGQVVRIAPDGTQTTVGSGFFGPFAVAVDGQNDVYVADPYVGEVDKITAAGTQTVFASGLNFPAGVAVDAAGDVYIVETGANAVDKIAVDGTHSVVASGLNGPAAAAVDPAGNVYIADTGNHRVLKVGPTGAQSVPVDGRWGLGAPNGVAVDAEGKVFAGDTTHNSVWHMDSRGFFQVLAQGFDNPSNVAVAPVPRGPLFGERVTLIAQVLAAPDTGSVPTGSVTFYESGTALGSAALDASGRATLAITLSAAGVRHFTASYGGDASNSASTSPARALDVPPRPTATVLSGAPAATQTLYLSDPLNQRLIEVAPDGTQTYIPFPAGAIPETLTVDSRGNIYVEDAVPQPNGGTAFDVVRFRPNGTSTIVWAGAIPDLPGANPVSEITVDANDNVLFIQRNLLYTIAPDGSLTSVPLVGEHNIVEGLAVDPSGDVFYSDGQTVFRRGVDGTTTSFVTTTPISTPDGFAPRGLAVDQQGNLIIADSEGALLSVAPDGAVSVIADNHQLGDPFAVAVDSSGAIYVQDDARLMRFTAPGVGAVVSDAFFDAAALSAPSVRSGHGDPVTLVAHVRGPSEAPGSPGGQVTFSEGATVLGTAPIQPGFFERPVAGLTVRDLAVGTHRITATYAGDANNAPSTSATVIVTVTKARSGTTLSTTPVPPATVYSLNGSTVWRVTQNGKHAKYFTDAAAVDLAVNRLGKVYLAESTRVLTIGANKKATVLANGFFDIQSIELDSAGNTFVLDAVDATNSSFRIVRIAPNGTQTVLADLGATAGHLAVDAAGDVFVTQSSLPNQIDDFFTTSQLLEVKADGTQIRLAPPGIPAHVNGMAAAPNGDLYLAGDGTVVRYSPNGAVTTIGSYDAQNLSLDRAGNLYVGDANTNQVIRISPNGTTKVLLSGVGAAQDVGAYIPPTSAAHGATVTLTANVIAAPDDGFVPTGTVTFMDGTATLGTVAVNAAGVARLTTTTLPVGAHTITAHYSGDANTTASVSIAATVTIT